MHDHSCIQSSAHTLRSVLIHQTTILMLTAWSGVCRLTYSIAPRSTAAEALKWSCGLNAPFGSKTAVAADLCK